MPAEGSPSRVPAIEPKHNTQRYSTYAVRVCCAKHANDSDEPKAIGMTLNMKRVVEEAVLARRRKWLWVLDLFPMFRE